MNNSKLFIGNLDYTVTADDLRAFFAQFGTITDCVVITDRATGRSKGFGFVQFAKPEEAKLAVEKGNGADMKGRKLNVNEARPQEPRN